MNDQLKIRNGRGNSPRTIKVIAIGSFVLSVVTLVVVVVVVVVLGIAIKKDLDRIKSESAHIGFLFEQNKKHEENAESSASAAERHARAASGFAESASYSASRAKDSSSSADDSAFEASLSASRAALD